MKYIRELLIFLQHIVENRVLLSKLIKNDFKKQYLGSYLGITWAFVQPLMMVAVLWFVFEVGFKHAPITNGIPFIVWLMSGMFPWYFFANAISGGTGSIRGNAFLIKKVAFRVSILPIVSITSALIIHLIFIIILFIIFFLNGIMPSIYWLQLPYYIFCLYILLLGLTWLSASLNVFVKDVGNVISIILQIGFWATPIFWSSDTISPKHIWIIKYNPIAYIVNGYRDSLIGHIWFWEKINVSIYFMIIALFFIILGGLVFKRLRPHFGDVL